MLFLLLITWVKEPSIFWDCDRVFENGNAAGALSCYQNLAGDPALESKTIRARLFLKLGISQEQIAIETNNIDLAFRAVDYYKSSLYYSPDKEVKERLWKLETRLKGEIRSQASITRSLSNDQSSTRGFTVREKKGVDLQINFAFNSAEMDPSGLAQAHELGKALSQPSMEGAHFQIIGHTDAVGSRSYNQRLSESRAKVVRAFLIRKYQLDPTRVEWSGRGEEELIYQDAGRNRMNRRVEVKRK